MSLVERSLIDDSCFVREMVSFVCIDSLVDLDVLMFVRGFELGDGRVRVLEIVHHCAVAQCGSHIWERDDVARSEPTLKLCSINTETTCMLRPLYSCRDS